MNKNHRTKPLPEIHDLLARITELDQLTTAHILNLVDLKQARYNTLHNLKNLSRKIDRLRRDLKDHIKHNHPHGVDETL